MQVITDSEASIVLLLFKKKITRWCSWKLKSTLKKSQPIRYGKVDSHRTCQTTLHINRQTKRGKLKKKPLESVSCWQSERNLLFSFAKKTHWLVLIMMKTKKQETKDNQTQTQTQTHRHLFKQDYRKSNSPTGSSPHFVVAKARTLPWPSLAAFYWERSSCITGLTGALCTAAVYSLSSLLSFSICFIVSSLVVLSLSNCPHLEQAAFFCHLFYVPLFLSISSSTPLCLWYVHLWSILVIFSHSIGRLPHFYLYFFLLLFVLFHFPEERPPISFMLLANPL